MLIRPGPRTPGYIRAIILATLPAFFHTSPLLASDAEDANTGASTPERGDLSGNDGSTDPTVPAALTSTPEPSPIEGSPPPSPREPTPSSLQFNLGLEWWFVRDKAIFGPTMRLGGRWVTAHADWALIYLREDTPAQESRWLGSIAGLYLSVSPIHTRRVETHLGLGTDIHWLHGIHSEEGKVAFAARASIHFWLSDNVGVFGTARTYLASSSGLGLGETPNHSRDLPLMLTLGIELR